MAHSRSHVAWSNSTSSLPVSLLSSSFDQSSICKGTSTRGGEQSRDGGLFLLRGLTHKCSSFHHVRPGSSSYFYQFPENLPEEFAQDWGSLSDKPPGFYCVKRTNVSPGPFLPSPSLATQDPAFKSLQPDFPKVPLSRNYLNGMQSVSDKRAPSSMPQKGAERELLPPIDLNDSPDSSCSWPSATSCFESVPYNYYSLHEKIPFSPAKATCEALCIFSDYGKDRLLVDENIQPVARPSNFDRRGYPGLTADPAAEGFRIRSPCRRLSYGGHVQTLGIKDLHRTAGSRELRRTIGYFNKVNESVSLADKSMEHRESTDRLQTGQHKDQQVSLPRSNQRLKIDTRGTCDPRLNSQGQYEKMNASNSKPRLWDAPDDEEHMDDVSSSNSAYTEGLIEKARYITISSPIPRMVIIPHRSSSSPVRPTTPQPALGLGSAFSPDTPPNTLNSPQEQFQERIDEQTKKLNALIDEFSLLTTPPNLRFVALGDGERRISSAFDSVVSLTEETLTGAYLSSASLQDAVSARFSFENPESVQCILTELEEHIAGLPAAGLELDSPCIVHIRLSFRENKPPQPPVFTSPSWAKPPYSRNSPLNPLGSHPPNDPYESPPRNNALSNSSPQRPANPLRAIFPNAAKRRLDSLQAASLALYYVSNIRLPLLSNEHAPEPHSIPPKACELLGPNPDTYEPNSPTAPASPGTLVENQERIENLGVGLRILVRGLVGEIEGRRLGKNDEALVRAMGELVRMGEGIVGVGEEVGKGMGMGKLKKKGSMWSMFTEK